MEQLTTEMILVMAMICVAVFLFIVEWIRVDVVAILMMVSLPLLKLVTPNEAFVGFSSNAVISIIAVIIIGAGLDKTGLINRVVAPVLRIAGNSTSRIVIAISMTVAGISSFMQNIGAAALFLPAIQRVSKRMKIPISLLLMPIGFSAILGGTLTLVGCSPLILLNDLLAPFNLPPFNLFDVTPVGAALVASGIAYFVVFGRFVLPRPKVSKEASEDATDAMPHDLTEPYDGMDEPRELRTPEHFTHYREPLTIEDLRKKYLVNVVAISEPPNLTTVHPPPDKELRDNTDLVLFGTEKNIERLAEEEEMVLKESLEVFKDTLSDENSGTVEAVVAPRSALLGRTLNEVKLADRFQVTPLAIHRHGRALMTDISDVTLGVGDAILFQGTWKRLKDLQNEKFLIFTTPIDVEEMKPEKALLAGFWLVVALTMVIAFKIQLSVCLMTGALGMVVTRVLTIDEAYQSVDWRTIFLLAGLIPLGIATEKTGTAAWIAHRVLGALGGSVPQIVLLTVIGVLATVFTLVISNVGATVLLVPLVVNMALAAGHDPRMAALVVGLATSNSFILPTHQVNALYMGPGHYRSVDFMKAGGVLSVVFIAVMIGTIYVFYL
jgi:di/tricarboxylate transporter